MQAIDVGGDDSDDGSGDGSGGGGSRDGGAAEAADALPPAPHLSAEELEWRCAGTLGDWCQAWLQQRPIPAKPPPRYNLTCLWDSGPSQCNFVGERFLGAGASCRAC